MKTSIQQFAVVAAIVAWVGVSAFVIAELSTTKQTIDMVARHQAAAVPLHGYASK